MAGILTVQTIQGPTSGANANKVIIPAGQTLEIDSWTPPAGTVLQVQHAKSTATEYTSTSTSFADAVSVSITPSATSSKILVMASGGTFDSSSSATGEVAIRDNSDTVLSTGYHARDSGEFSGGQISMNVLDSPSTTSSITYKVSYRLVSGGGIAYFANSTPILITVMEIAQ